MKYCIKNDGVYIFGGFDSVSDAEFYRDENFNANVCTIEKENRFYGLNQEDGKIVFIGEFDSFSEADEAVMSMDINCVWIFDDAGAFNLMGSAVYSIRQEVGDFEKSQNKLRGLS